MNVLSCVKYRHRHSMAHVRLQNPHAEQLRRTSRYQTREKFDPLRNERSTRHLIIYRLGKAAEYTTATPRSCLIDCDRSGGYSAFESRICAVIADHDYLANHRIG